MIRIYVFLIVSLFLNFTLYAQNKQKIEISIREASVMISDHASYLYLLSGSKLKVYKEVGNKRFLKCSRRVTDTELDSIISYSKYILDNKYHSYYKSSNHFDGTRWFFKIGLNEIKNSYTFDNCQLPAFNKLLNILNKVLPRRKNYIIFDRLNQCRG